MVYPGIDPEFRPGEPAEIAATRRELGAPGRGTCSTPGRSSRARTSAADRRLGRGCAREDPKLPPLVLAGPYGWGSERLARRIRTSRRSG